MTTPTQPFSGPKYVSTTSPVNQIMNEKSKSPLKIKTDPINDIRNKSIETGKDQNNKFITMKSNQSIDAKDLKKNKKNSSEETHNEIKKNPTVNSSLPFQFKIPEGLPTNHKRKREENPFESPMANLKVAHTEKMNRPTKLSESEREYDLEQPSFKELNTRFNSELANEIFLDITPESNIHVVIERKLEVKNNETAMKVESNPEELSQSVQAALKALMKRETTLEEMCTQLKDLANERMLKEFVKELDEGKLEKFWSFESKMLIGRSEIDARNARLMEIFSLLSESQLKTSLNLPNFITIIGDTINGSANAAAEGFSPEMLEIIASESKSIEKVHSLGNVIASFEIHNTPKLKRNLEAVSNVHPLGIVDTTEKISRKAKLERLGASFNLKSMQVSPTSRNILNKKVKVAVTPQKK